MSSWNYSLPISPPDDSHLNSREVDDEVGRMSEDREILAGWLEGADLPEIPADLLATVACCRGDQLAEAADKIGVILGDAFADDDTNRQDAYERLVARGQRDAEEHGVAA